MGDVSVQRHGIHDCYCAIVLRLLTQMTFPSSLDVYKEDISIKKELKGNIRRQITSCKLAKNDLQLLSYFIEKLHYKPCRNKRASLARKEHHQCTVKGEMLQLIKKVDRSTEVILSSHTEVNIKRWFPMP